jgi:hypothetical protein
MPRRYSFQTLVTLCLMVMTVPLVVGTGCPVIMPGGGTTTGSCCAANGTCTVTAQADCAAGLTWTSGGTCTPNPCTPAVTPVTPQLFVANFVGRNVVSFVNPSTVNGNQAPNTNLAGAQTQIINPADIVVTASGILHVANRLAAPTGAITVYPGASTANGNVVPARNVQGANTGLALPTTLAISPTNDLLFVANNVAPFDINVYTGASTTGFNGNLAPARTIKSAALNLPFGINMGVSTAGNAAASDDLYVANNGTSQILVFANASTRNGVITPDRTLTNAAFAGLFDCFVDSGDRLYVVNGAGGGGNRIHVINNASTRNGAVTIDSTLTVTGAVDLTAIAVDRNQTGYVVDRSAPGGGAVYAYDTINTKNGAFAPNRSITGASTQFDNPIRVFLVE